MNSDSISDEQWVNELVMSLSMLMNEDKLEEVVSLGKASLARVRVLHENDGVLAFVLHQLGAGLCGLSEKKNQKSEEGWSLLEEAASVFLQNEMPAQAGASLAVLAETAQAIGKPVLAADYCLRCFALVSEEKQDFMMFTWWECLKEMEAPDQIVNLNHLLRLYYPPGKKKREWSTPEGLIRLALAERFYGMHQFGKAKAMLMLALADEDPRMRDMLRRTKITIAICNESLQSGVFAEKLRNDASVVSAYRMCQSCERVADNLSICSGCRKVWYCSQEHQQRDWKQHKQDCAKK